MEKSCHHLRGHDVKIGEGEKVLTPELNVRVERSGEYRHYCHQLDSSTTQKHNRADQGGVNKLSDRKFWYIRLCIRTSEAELN